MITLRIRSVEPTIRVRATQVIPTPELQAAISGAQSAQTAAEAAQAAAETAETSAETAATNAASSASSASTSASNASSSASSASSSASGASTSATNASNSASVAATSASNAASSASSASSSASSAAASAADAAMSADSFDDVWLGTKTSDPTVDNDGNPLATGQLYFNVISNTLKIYNGTAWQSYTAASGLSAVVDDTAPSLGGNLSLNGHNITAAGTEKVDGRDVSVDGAKLDTIASNADVTSATNVGSSIHGATAKTTPVDADETALIDSAASNVLKKVTWANVKATIKTYFDTLYQPLASALTSWASVTRASGFDTFAATPSSANLASLMTDETGTGANVFASAPTLVNPVVGTQTAEDASTKAASTAYADTSRRFMDQVGYNSGSPKSLTQANDGGRLITLYGGTTYTVNLDQANVTSGKFICAIQNSNSGNCTIAYTGSGQALNWLPSGGTGSRTLAANGICVVWHNGGAFYIAGQGLT